MLKQLKKIDKKQAKRISVKIYMLAGDPRPANSKQLKNRDEYSMRVGDYRVLYIVDDGKVLIYVMKVGHRKDVYK